MGVTTNGGQGGRIMVIVSLHIFYLLFFRQYSTIFVDIFHFHFQLLCLAIKYFRYLDFICLLARICLIGGNFKITPRIAAMAR